MSYGDILQVVMSKPVLYTNYYDVYAISDVNVFVVDVHLGSSIPASYGGCSCAPMVSVDQRFVQLSCALTTNTFERLLF